MNARAPLPSDAAFLTLRALVRSEDSGVRAFGTLPDRNQMFSFQPDGPPWAVGDELDELTARGWVDVGADRITVTEAGRYWANRHARGLKTNGA